MSFENMLDHLCDIYHMKKSEESPGYNLPAFPTFSYPEQPDLSAVPCHFSLKYTDNLMRQGMPATEYSDRIKLVLPEDVDVRLNDKIVNCENGLQYTAQVPKSIRGHHKTVFIKPVLGQKEL